MGTLKETNWVVHSNAFAPAIHKTITLVEQRMLAIYLSKINPNNPETCEVCFRLEDYERMMGLQRFNITQLKECAKQIIAIPVILDQPGGGFTACPLFSRFKLEKIDEEWFVFIKCSEDVMAHLFHLQKEFVRYALWNILNLTERNHQQLYRILKQYERIGEKTMSLEKLKFGLGLDGKHEKFYDFRRDVLEPCQQALAEKTDLRFEYEPIRKGRKVHAIRFTIHKNTPPSDKPLLSDFVAQMAKESARQLEGAQELPKLGTGFQLSADGQADTEGQAPPEGLSPPVHTYSTRTLELFADACKYTFNEAEMELIADVLRRAFPVATGQYPDLEFDRYHALQTAYLEMEARGNVKHKVSYLVKMLEAKSEEKQPVWK